MGALRLFPFITLSILLVSQGATAQSVDVFRGFTSHIQHQIRSDKKTFLEAQVCTEWFYKQLYQKPSRPPAEPISWRSTEQPPSISASCQSRYPDGLEAARKDFSLTQSSLSLSLTFYEFALVGDRDDDERYSEGELRDILESFGLPYDRIRPLATHLLVLNAQFDTLRRDRGMEALMAGMGVLYEKGYRFTAKDRAALDQITQ